MSGDTNITAREMVDTNARAYTPAGDDRVVVAPAPAPAPVIRQETAVAEPRDRIRWGPIWGGLIATITIFLVLELLMYGFGWLTLDFTGGDAPGTSAAWVSTLMALIAFFIGGWVAQATSSVRGADAGLLNGFMVWALAITLILLFSTLGLGLAFGPVGSVLNQFNIIGRGDLRALDPAAIERAFRQGTLWSVLFLIVSAGAAAAGGWLGDAKPDDPIGHLAEEGRGQTR